MNTSKLLNKGIGMLRKTSAMGKALYNSAKTISHTTTPGIIHSVEKPTAQEMLDAAIKWKKENPDFSLPPGKSVITPTKRVPVEYQTPRFQEAKKKLTAEQELLNLYFGDEHNI